MVTYGPPDNANEAILGRMLLTSVVLRDLSRATLDDAQKQVRAIVTEAQHTHPVIYRILTYYS